MLSTNLIAKIKVSFGSFSFILGNPLFWISAALIVAFLLYRMGIKKFVIFSFITSGCFYLMFKIDKYIINFFGKEEGEFYTLLTKPLFVFIIGFFFIYYMFIQRD